MKKVILSTILAAFILSGCKSLNNTQKGTAIGGTAGAAAGAIIGGKNHSVLGAIIGAAVGGTAGYFIGNHMDKEAEAIKSAIPDAEVNRVGEGINVTFNSALLFKINSSDLSDSAKANLSRVATVFTDYPETYILVEGHTDDTGPENFNMQLSEKRAKSVAGYLESKGIDPTRFVIKWYGENQPKYPNDSEKNRILNRRVELGIYANEQMKSNAEKNATGGQK